MPKSTFPVQLDTLERKAGEQPLVIAHSAGLPPFRIALAVETGNHHNPVLLNFKEYSVREAPHSRTAAVPVDDGELEGVFCDCLNRRLDCQGEAPAKLRAYVLIPCPRFSEICVRFWYPDDRERHGFLD
jgi:hypothetical protein